jgi:N-glycosylase/DNA lyase
MLQDNNGRFDKTDAYRQIRAGYREGGQKNLGRLKLLKALVAFQFRSRIDKNWQSTADLNP